MLLSKAMLLSSQPTRCARILARGVFFFFFCMLNKAILPFLPPFCDSKEKHRSNMYIEYYNKRNMHCVWGSGERERQRHREVETETHTHTQNKCVCISVSVCLMFHECCCCPGPMCVCVEPSPLPTYSISTQMSLESGRMGGAILQ